MIFACDDCTVLRVPASTSLKAVLVVVAVVAVIGLCVALVRVVRRAGRARLAWLAVGAGILLLPVATSPVINDVTTTTSGRHRAICGKPAMVFENPAFSSSGPAVDNDRVSGVAACREAFAGRWRLSAFIGAAGALLIAAGVVAVARGGGLRRAPRSGDPVVTGPIVAT